MSEECAICGLDLDEKFSQELKCNHKFHYECLMKTFQNTYCPKLKRNHCPYCRDSCGFLPVVNGLKKLQTGVHAVDISGYCVPVNVPCKYILKKGKNKGNACNKKCFLGYEYCKVHKKAMKV